MSGNVLELCYDWDDSIEAGDVTDPTGALSDSHRVARGGGWGYIARSALVCYRGNDRPDYWDDNLGFRVCRSAN